MFIILVVSQFAYNYFTLLLSLEFRNIKFSLIIWYYCPFNGYVYFKRLCV